ncbi:carbohydrate-binding protein [Kitasatospora sp. NPDC002965]|uniref:carbohydrate-binding protein n=1 Tax=Kitasatospora sp. NPDC002965 TaxID=3154775 RepID=UPI00339EA68A
MTTAGNSGVPQGPEGGTPQDDDPFGYLYRPADGAAAAQPSEPQQGVPRTPYSRPMEVGRAQYGQQARPQQPYPAQPGYPQAPQPGQPYPPQGEYGGVPAQHPEYGGGAPTQQARYAEHSRPQPGEERPGGGRGKGAVIGAVAVVAAVAIGAGIALSGGDPDKDKDKNAKGATSSTGAPATPGGTGSTSPTAPASATASATPVTGPATVDASGLQGQNAPSGNSVKGTKSADGAYLTLQPGGSVSWNGELAAAGTYKFTVHFNNPGTDVKAVASVNGKDWPGGLSFKNYSPGKEPAASWYTTYITPPLQAGANTITLTVPAGSGAILVDQVVLEAAG